MATDATYTARVFGKRFRSRLEVLLRIDDIEGIFSFVLCSRASGRRGVYFRYEYTADAGRGGSGGGGLEGNVFFRDENKLFHLPEFRL